MSIELGGGSGSNTVYEKGYCMPIARSSSVLCGDGRLPLFISTSINYFASLK